MEYIHITSVNIRDDKMAKSLGNDMPPILQEVISRAWKAVCQIACGIVNPVAAVKTFLNTIDWEDINTAAVSAIAGWYHENDIDRVLSDFYACEMRARHTAQGT